jgi:hypothetical protein
MAVTLGISAGFVLIRPTVSPEGTSSYYADNYHGAQKFTAPADAGSLIEIGWYDATSTEEANFEVGIYSHDAGNNRPGNRLATSGDIAKGTGAGWKYSAVPYALIPLTVYWLAMTCDDTASNTMISYETDAGQKWDYHNPGVTPLPASWGTSDGTGGYLFAIYGLYTEASGGGGSLVVKRWGGVRHNAIGERRWHRRPSGLVIPERKTISLYKKDSLIVISKAA